MKELSIEEKAKRYNEAIKKAETLYKAAEPMSGCNVIIETLFPELEESEDERVKRCISDVVRKYGSEFTTGTVTKEKMFAWLEKQGENNMGISDTTKQKLKDNLNNALEKETPESWNEFLDEHKPMTGSKFKVGNKVVHKGTGKTWTVHWYIKEDNTYSVEDTEGLINIYSPDVLELIEQKSAWSEEDEKIRSSIIDFIRYELNHHAYIGTAGVNSARQIEWLESLKDRVIPQNKWKPSDEQITWLYRAADDASKDSRMKQILNELLYDLKKLRE